MPTNFSGTLNSNEIFSALFNMIISQQVFADNISDTSSELVDMARVDGGLYGDTKLYYATDVLRSHPWGNDAEAENLLALDRPPSPKCQAIELNVFRQIRLTIDSYLSKRAWSTEGAFSSFTSIMLGWIRETKRIYDSTRYNAYIGTTVAAGGLQSHVINVPAEPASGATEPEQEAYSRIKAQTIAADLANLMVDVKDISRDYNDYGYLRSFDPKSLIIVWNSEVVNEIKKLDLPTIFHKDGLFGEDAFRYVLPARYFGNKNVDQTEAGTGVRSLVEKDYNTVAMNSATYNPRLHVFPGDLIPTGQTAAANESYTENPNIAYKIMHRDSVPYMSAFEVGTSFFNARSLSENRYLTYGCNTLTYLMNYPFITGTVVAAG